MEVVVVTDDQTTADIRQVAHGAVQIPQTITVLNRDTARHSLQPRKSSTNGSNALEALDPHVTLNVLNVVEEWQQRRKVGVACDDEVVEKRAVLVQDAEVEVRLDDGVNCRTVGEVGEFL